MKEVKYDNYIVMWNGEFQECNTLERALTDVQDLLDSENVSASDITLYGCTEIELDITISSKVEVKK
jgi:hypothetical protein